MLEIMDHPVRVGDQDEAEFFADLVRWLIEQPQPEPSVRWRNRGLGSVQVPSVGHLAELVGALAYVGAWGVVDREPDGPWAQVMRVPEGWIVEVDGGIGPDAFARRVRWAEHEAAQHSDPPLSCANPLATGGATYFLDELIPSPEEAARILWTWLRRGLRAGYEVRVVEDNAVD